VGIRRATRRTHQVLTNIGSGHVPLNAVGKGEKGPMVAMNAEDVKAAVKTSTEQSAQTAPSTGSSQN